MTPALYALSRGDEAWWHDDRGTAVQEWRAALAAVGPEPADRAAEAMARLRLLKLGGNLAAWWHERRIGQALAECPDSEPWCAIALADWEWLMPSFVGADPGRIVDLLVDSPLSGPAAARRAMGGEGISALEGLDLDGMGRGMRDAGRVEPPFPGTWVVGVGLGAAPGSGFGATVRFVHPDLFWRAHRLELLVGGDSRGSAYASSHLTLRTSQQFSALAAHSEIDRWIEGLPTAFSLTTFRGSAGIAPRLGQVRVQVGGLGRWDNSLVVGGGYGAVTIGSLRFSGEVNGGDYFFASLGWDARVYPEVLGGVLALRAAGTFVPTEDAPWFRWPYAGGTDLLRGLPTGRYRDTRLAAAQVEYRHTIWGPVQAVAFVDAAAIEGLHATYGGGVHLVLPPGKDNITRLEVGFGEGSWGVVVAWGEGF